MSGILIDGAALAIKVKADVQQRAAQLAAQGRRIALTAVLVGSTPAGELYARRQAEAAAAVGIEYALKTLPADSSFNAVADLLRSLSADPAITGIMLHLPLPGHLDATELQYRIDPVKDVEGVNPANIGYVVYGHTLIAPCTALAVIELIESTGVPLRGAEAVVVGASEIAGKPISLLLTQRLATVTLCHIATRDLAAHARRADVLVVAVGKAGLITADHVREGAVVIDVGINRITQPDGTRKTMGDVDFDAVAPRAGYITPVPGGVGPMTVAMLLKNTVRSAELLATGKH
jgi:methylenetetrahydrofolate dehydrogenase (NADP+)/methenyltetrahydrofolate cyclohydrolase